jgi:hypothetical protein
MQRNLAIVFGLLVSASMQTELFAQATPPKNNAQVAKFEGTLEDGKGNMIQVVNDKSEKRVVTLPKDMTQVRYSAEALPQWLTPGMFVRFGATLNERGQASGPLESLEVFLPDPPQVMRRLPPEQLRQQVPGIYPAGAAAGNNLLNNQPQANAGPQNYNVVGQIAGLQQDRIAVKCGDVPLQMTITDKTKIKVNAYGLDLAQKGDKVSVSGLATAKSAESITADHVYISPVKPLGTPPDPAAADTSLSGKKKGGKSTKSPKPPKPPTE